MKGLITKKHNSKLLELQLLRGVAALLVVIHHAALAVEIRQPDLLAEQGWGGLLLIRYVGAAGVDLFFVLSGFFMYYSVCGKASGPASALEFLRRRVIRVWPAYLIASFVFLAILVALTSFKFDDPAYILKSVFMLPVFDGENKLRPVLGVGWTLVYEAYFYVIIAVALAWKRGGFFLRLICGVCTPAVLGFVFDFTSPLALFLTDNLLIEFSFGAVLAYAYINFRKPSFAVSCAAAGIGWAFLILSVFLGGLEMRVAIWGLPCLAIAFSFIGMEVKRWHAPLVFVGEISYSLYLIHTILFFCVNSLWKRGFLGADLNSNLMILGLSLAALPAGYVFYVMVERPLVKRLSLS